MGAAGIPCVESLADPMECMQSMQRQQYSQGLGAALSILNVYSKWAFVSMLHNQPSNPQASIPAQAHLQFCLACLPAQHFVQHVPQLTAERILRAIHAQYGGSLTLFTERVALEDLQVAWGVKPVGEWGSEPLVSLCNSQHQAGLGGASLMQSCPLNAPCKNMQLPERDM